MGGGEENKIWKASEKKKKKMRRLSIGRQTTYTKRIEILRLYDCKKKEGAIDREREREREHSIEGERGREREMVGRDVRH